MHEKVDGNYQITVESYKKIAEFVFACIRLFTFIPAILNLDDI